MKWRKLGRVFCPGGEKTWMRSHASNPTAVQIDGDLYRVYFSTRDALNRSSITWVEIDVGRPNSVVRIAEKPVLNPGELGCFDDSGCSIGSLVRKGGKLLLYYMGWNLCVTVPWRNAIGLAVSSDGGDTFEKVSPAPVMDRGEMDPFTLSYPWVIYDKEEMHMWYGSNLRWGAAQTDMFHMIKYATSFDGRTWQRNGMVVIHPSNESEYAFARPSVIKDAHKYRMWYSFRGLAYRIGYAESEDGTSWIRRDAEAGIDVSPGDWDGSSVEYPCVFDHEGTMYMLYNGDGYGLTGFGAAVMEA
jgi:hypothetical protein